MTPMSTSYIGSDALASPVTPLTIPGFDVLNPTGSAPSSPTAAPAPAASSPSTESSYQQTLDNLTSWEYQYLYQSLNGTNADANALYATAGLSVDQFANLATELQALNSSSAPGSTIDTQA